MYVVKYSGRFLVKFEINKVCFSDKLKDAWQMRLKDCGVNIAVLTMRLVEDDDTGDIHTINIHRIMSELKIVE